MKKRQTIEEEVLKTLQYLDTHEKLQTGPYFYSRLQSRIKQAENEEKFPVFKSVKRSVFILACCFIIGFANLTSAIWFFQGFESDSYDRSTYITAFADDYSLNQNYTYIYNEAN